MKLGRALVMVAVTTTGALLMGAAVWGGYLFLQSRWVTQLYCARQDEVQIALVYLKSLEDRAGQDEFTIEMFREEIVSSFKSALRSVPPEFRPYWSDLSAGTKQVLSSIESNSLDESKISETIHEPCVFAFDRWMRLIPAWPLLPEPQKKLSWKSELRSWHARFIDLSNRVPQAYEQLASDQSLLCRSVESVKRAKDTLDFYIEGCRGGNKTCIDRETKRLSKWMSEQESDLKLNAERFIIKWGEKRFAKTGCVKEKREETKSITGRTTRNYPARRESAER